MGRFVWTKTGRDWLGIYGQFRAKIRAPYEGGFMYHWSVWTVNDKQGGSGGTSSVVASKRAAEKEIERFSTWLLDQELHALG